MKTDSRHIKRAVVLFSLSPNKESTAKKITDVKRNNSAILKSLFDHTVEIVQTAQLQTNFDFIISSSNISTIKNCKHIEQKGSNFDERIRSTVSSVFNLGYDEVIIVGNDCPNLSPELFEHSFNSLSSNDVVVGPSSDGGFYLLALKKNDENIYNDIRWYSSKVLPQLLDNIITLNFTFVLLPELNDIDDYADLIDLLKDCNFTNLQFYLQLKQMLIVYQLFISIYSIKFSSSESYLKIWQKPPPVILLF